MRTLSHDSAFSPSSIKLTGRFSSVLALAVIVGACSNMGTLRSPVFTGSTNQQQIISGNGTTPLGGTYVGAPPNGAVASADLPPPTAPAYAATAPSYAAPAPNYAAQAPNYGAQAPQTGPRGYTPPATSTAMASQPAPIHRGTPPTTLGEQAARIESTSVARGSAVHTVQPGDTAWNISQRYGITVDQLAAANGGSTTVKLGTRIAIPGATAPQTGVQVASLDPTYVAAPTPTAPIVPMRAAVEENAAPLARARAQQEVALAPQTGTAGSFAQTPPPPSAAAAGFRWPVRGRIIASFGKKADGERNDGINLAVPEGTSVKSAEDGTVIYAGNELKSYGNLVLIRHTGGWVSAYAHNSELRVKRGDQVRRGQVIALSGMSGGVTTPQVHFELRKDATPVDPLKHLTEA